MQEKPRLLKTIYQNTPLEPFTRNSVALSLKSKGMANGASNKLTGTKERARAMGVEACLGLPDEELDVAMAGPVRVASRVRLGKVDGHARHLAHLREQRAFYKQTGPEAVAGTKCAIGGARQLMSSSDGAERPPGAMAKVRPRSHCATTHQPAEQTCLPALALPPPRPPRWMSG